MTVIGGAIPETVQWLDRKESKPRAHPNLCPQHQPPCISLQAMGQPGCGSCLSLGSGHIDGEIWKAGHSLSLAAWVWLLMIS